MAATFMMKLVISSTKRDIPMTKTNQWASVKKPSQLMASHSAAPVCHRQKPMLMAPANNRMMFQGIASRSWISRMSNTKNKTVATRITADLLKAARAGTKDCRDKKRMAPSTIRPAPTSLRDKPPISSLSCLAFCRRPGMRSRSGLNSTMKKTHNSSTISQPMGAI